MLDPDIIKRLKNNNDFLAFTDFVFFQIDELNSVKGLKDFSNERAGEEVKVRTKAIEVLELILLPFTHSNEKKKPTTEVIQKKKDEYGL